MVTGSRRAAIFYHNHNRGRKKVPHVLYDIISAAAIFDGDIQDGGGENDVWRTSELRKRRPPDACPHQPWVMPSSQKGQPSPQICSVEAWLLLLRGIWSLASPSHSRNDWVSCPLATTQKSISLHVPTPCPMGNCYPWDMVWALASTYFFCLYFNCTVQ